jgi:glycosyltransferase involved in cell wall biosynthesis
MAFIDSSKFHLIIVGGGDLFETIVQLVDKQGLNDRITIIPKVPFEVLKYITSKAHLGFTVDKPNNINHIYGLPNKIFDYLHAGVPVLSTRLVELEKIIKQYDVGGFLESNDPKHIADCVHYIFEQPQLLERWRKNTLKVKMDLNWENEEKILLRIFKKVCEDAGLTNG